jgi:thymidylate synthase
MQQYIDLIDRVLTPWQGQKDRTGVGTRYLFGEHISFDLTDGFPIVSLRKINYKAAFAEAAGFIRGVTSKKAFSALGCNYWNTTGDSDDLGPIYGYQWRNWGGDQLAKLVQELMYNPFSRRHILSTWNVDDLDSMALPPCHIIAQFNVQQDKNQTPRLDCLVYMRSVDIMLGLPYDIIVYALLTHLLAKECQYTVGMLRFTFGNAHIYDNHTMDAIKLIKLEPQAGMVGLKLAENTSLFNFKPEDAELLGYNPGPSVEFKLNL